MSFVKAILDDKSQIIQYDWKKIFLNSIKIIKMDLQIDPRQYINYVLNKTIKLTCGKYLEAQHLYARLTYHLYI